MKYIVTIFVFLMFVFSGYKLLYSQNSVDWYYEGKTYTNEYVMQHTKSDKDIPILVYHKIIDASLFDNFFVKKYEVSRDVFEEQIKYVLVAGYTPLTMHELITDYKNKTLPAKPIVITFDDGWKSQYTNAFPILKQYNVKGTFYIYDSVISQNPFYMTWDNLKELNNSNMEIGGHSVHHPNLVKLNKFRQTEEIKENFDTLSKNLNFPIYDFAYPYGSFNSAVEEIVKNAGYESARTSEFTKYNNFQNLYELKSLYAPPDLETLKEMI